MSACCCCFFFLFFLFCFCENRNFAFVECCACCPENTNGQFSLKSFWRSNLVSNKTKMSPWRTAWIPDAVCFGIMEALVNCFLVHQQQRIFAPRSFKTIQFQILSLIVVSKNQRAFWQWFKCFEVNSTSTTASWNDCFWSLEMVGKSNMWRQLIF